MFDFSKEAILSMLTALPAILFCLSIHELAHGWVANRLGDPTARNFGRLSMNPLKHLDPFGFIALLFVGFGWAKPVPVNARHFKKPKRDMALVAIAGPLSNFISAFVFGFVLLLVTRLYTDFIVNSTPDTPERAFQMWQVGYSIVANFFYINVSLAIFNLIPIPPLDGSRILDTFLPTKAYLAYHKYEQYVSIILMVLLVSNTFDPILSAASGKVSELLLFIPRKVFFP